MTEKQEIQIPIEFAYNLDKQEIVKKGYKILPNKQWGTLFYPIRFFYKNITRTFIPLESDRNGK
jgi:hypothetical protein